MHHEIEHIKYASSFEQCASKWRALSYRICAAIRHNWIQLVADDNQGIENADVVLWEGRVGVE